ncbi:MAG: hypothetical protein ACRD9W_20670, partial [Terriglobia bacterium]
MIKGIIVLLSSAVVLMAQPAVTVKSLIDEEPRVYLLPPTSPEFAKAVAASPYDLIRQVTPLHPYSAVMVNDTNQDVFAYAVGWKGTDDVGKDLGQTFETGSLYTLPFAPSDVPAHSAAVLLPRIGPADVAASRRPERVQEALGKQLVYLGRYRSLTITLQAVLFNDGLAVGQDPLHFIPRWKAHLDATKEIAALMSGRPDAEVRAGLEELVKAGVERSKGTMVKGNDLASYYA